MRKLSAPLLYCCLVFCLLAAAPAGAETGARWRPHDEASMQWIDHGAWESFLLSYVRPGEDGVHRLAYGRVKDADREALGDYLRQLSKVDIVRYRRDEQMAYWINLYNALTVDLILDYYPIASIRKLPGQAAGRHGGPWDRKLIDIDGIALSLNDIEKRILKPIWRDPRIQYAITCGAIGCPNLQPEPFSGEHLERQLSHAAMAYVNDPRCINIEDGQLRVSSLYRWNISDFGGSDQGIIHHLMAYAEPDLAMALQGFDHIDGDGFDWRLNDASD